MSNLKSRHMMRLPFIYATLGWLTIASWIVAANETMRYQLPPQAMIDMVDSPLIPQTSLSPTKEWLMLLERPALPSVNELAQPELRLAGLRVNPRNNDQSRNNYAIGMRFIRIVDRTERNVGSLPSNARIGDAQWSPDGKRVAFTLVRDTAIDLMVVEVANGFQAKRIVERPLNGAMVGAGRAFSWFGDSKSLLVALIPQGRGAPPRAPVVTNGPSVQENLGRRNAARTYQNLLKSPHDEAQFDYYGASEVARVWLDGKTVPIVNGIVRNFAPSPDGQYALIQTVKRPYSYTVPVTSFALKTEIRDAFEENIGAVIRVLSDLPLAEDEEIDADAVRKGPRQYAWRSDVNATITWAQAIEMRRNGLGDYFFMLQSPFDGEPQLLEKLDLRFQNIVWGNDTTAFVTEMSRKTRKTITCLVYTSPSPRDRQKSHMPSSA